MRTSVCCRCMGLITVACFVFSSVSSYGVQSISLIADLSMAAVVGASPCMSPASAIMLPQQPLC